MLSRIFSWWRSEPSAPSVLSSSTALAVETSTALAVETTTAIAGHQQVVRDQVEAVTVGEGENPPLLKSWFQWVRTGPELLQFWEKRMLQVVKTPFRQTMIDVGPFKINTLIMADSNNGTQLPSDRVNDGSSEENGGNGHLHENGNKNKPALVMVHGFGGGIGFWTCNLDELSKNYDIYAFDLIGFGRSSRSADIKFRNEHDALKFFVDSVEQWRQSLGLNKIVLMGHSLGAYLAADFAMKYPQYLSHVILVDPFGIPRRPLQEELATRKIPLRYRILAKLISLGDPLYMIRLVGPWGFNIVERMRPDFVERFKHLYPTDNKSVLSYIYHLNAQSPATGERAFRYLSLPFGYAKLPLCQRIPKEWDRRVPLTFIYGAQSWMDHNAASLVRAEMQDHPNIDIVVIPNAGHHCYADNYAEFNRIVNDIAPKVNNQHTERTDQ